MQFLSKRLWGVGVPWVESAHLLMSLKNNGKSVADSVADRVFVAQRMAKTGTQIGQPEKMDVKKGGWIRSSAITRANRAKTRSG